MAGVAEGRVQSCRKCWHEMCLCAGVLVCVVQVDVTAQGEATDTAAPKWTKTASDEQLRAKQGNQAANLISNALQNMGWGASPWAKLQGHIMRTKPHKVRASKPSRPVRSRASGQGCGEGAPAKPQSAACSSSSSGGLCSLRVCWGMQRSLALAGCRVAR